MPNLLHIGLHKTGTTSLQAFLRDHEHELQAVGARFPRGLLQLNCHFELPLALMRTDRYSPSRLKGDDWRDPDWRFDLVQQVTDDLRAHPDELTILSCEELSLLRFDDELAQLRQIVGDADIVVYLRDPRLWLASLRAEQEKIGFGRSPDPNAYNYLEPDSWIADHQARVNSWRRHFSRVRVYNHDTCLAEDGSVIPAFCRHIGIATPADAGDYWLNKRGTINEGRVPGTRWCGGRFGGPLVRTDAWHREQRRRTTSPQRRQRV